MVKISDLVKYSDSAVSSDCPVVLSGDTSLRDAIARMDEYGCDQVTIADNGHRAVLSKETILSGLLCELDRTEEKMLSLQEQIEDSISTQIDLVKTSIKSIADVEMNKLQVAVNYMTEGMVIINNLGDMERANPAAKKLLGLRSTDSDEQLLKVIDSIGFRDLIAQSSCGTQNHWGEFKVKSSADKILQMRWTEMSDEAGDICGTLIMIRDVTDELAGEKAKTEFIAAITHELRTPLTIIQNSVSNMIAGVTGKIAKKTRNYLTTMEQDCKRFGILISDLLDMSKLEAGNMPLNRTVVDVKTMIENAVSGFSNLALADNIALTSSVSDHIMPSYADSQRIEQVLSNLISNAIKYTDPFGKIQISAYDDEQNLTIEVDDTGIGIDDEHMPYVFDKFQQIDRQAGAGYKGTGLGLAICSGIIEMHGGKIWAQSQQDKGSKFCFSIPKVDPVFILNRYMASCEISIKANDRQMSLIMVRLESTNPEDRTVIRQSIRELIGLRDQFLNPEDNLSFLVDDATVAFVLRTDKKRHIDIARKKLSKIVKNNLSNSWNDTDILPICGVAVYPTEAKEVLQLDSIARQNFQKL